MKNVILDITGMGCGGCASAVKGALEEVEGVHGADVDLEEARARVRADDGVADDALLSAVEAAGYGATARGLEE